ncbi:MAG: hypothetical protein H6622_06785 [Halobacteriovoraceae bacterium]|nr:hypothetical protein [Halobacteriovoraceae bacterium]
MNKLVLIVDCSKGEKIFFESIAAYCNEAKNLNINIFPVSFELITPEYITEMSPDLIIAHDNFEDSVIGNVKKIVLIDTKSNDSRIVEVSTPLTPQVFQNLFINL